MFPAIAETLQEIKEITGYQSRIRPAGGKKILGDFHIEDVRIKKKMHPMITWTSPNAKKVKVKVFLLLKKYPTDTGKLICSQRTFQTSKGTHVCYVLIKDYYFMSWGKIEKYFVEIRNQNHVVASKEYPSHIRTIKPDETLWHERTPDGQFHMYSRKTDILPIED
ncbi:MAG: hypothetical protein JW774_10165 [Candidatus Aureabacteria bacterium]|nr:hypothetical protein [Candidatus Auribacterota bacterium]